MYQLPEPVATLHDDGYYTTSRTPEGKVTKYELAYAGHRKVVYADSQMQQAYDAGREAMRQECVKVCDKYKNACWAITANIKELK